MSVVKEAASKEEKPNKKTNLSGKKSTPSLFSVTTSVAQFSIRKVGSNQINSDAARYAKPSITTTLGAWSFPKFMPNTFQRP